jgi:hypothetical protein
MADATVWGLVNGTTATPKSGTGYKVDHVQAGVYTVLFDKSFNGIPSVVVTQVYPDDLNSTGGNTLDNAVVIGISNDRFRVTTGAYQGAKQDRDFAFIAMGSS